jgi:hypothetical protein
MERDGTRLFGRPSSFFADSPLPICLNESTKCAEPPNRTAVACIRKMKQMLAITISRATKAGASARRAYSKHARSKGSHEESILVMPFACLYVMTVLNKGTVRPAS